MIDQTNKSILAILQADAKTTIKEISQQLDLSMTAVYERVKRLEREGYIEGYTIRLNRKMVNLDLLAYCHVSLKEHSKDFLDKFQKEVGTISEILECHHIAGPFDYLLKVVVPDMNAYQLFISDKLAILDNIGQVQSFFVMKEIKHNASLPLFE